ncbi:MAG: hypothetical protein ACK5WH_13700 [Hyphomonadaceae bacterium]
MTQVSATTALETAQRDFASFVIYGSRSAQELAIANEYLQNENGAPESEWAPITAGLIRTCVKNAYKFSGQ